MSTIHQARWAGLAAALVAGATAVAVAGVVGAPADAVVPAGYTLAGTVTNAAGAPVDFDRIELRRETTDDDPIAILDDADNTYYDELPEFGPDGTATGHYSVAVEPGTYRVDVHYLPGNGSLDQTSVSHVTIADQDELHHDVHTDDTLACQTAGTISGTTQVGQTLTAVPGAFSPDSYSRTLSYQWWRHDTSSADSSSWTRLTGERAATYTLTEADLGMRLEVDVFGLSDFGYARCDYADSDVVVAAQPPTTGSPAVDPPTVPPAASIGLPPGPISFGVGAVGRPSGRAVVGGALRVPSLSLPAGTTVGYQWFRASRHGSRTVIRAIAGARGSAYRPRRADRRAQVFVRIVLAAPGFAGTTLTSGRVTVR